jgi:GntR family transcriptional regulator
LRPGRGAEARDDLRQRITTGHYQPGDRLPRLVDLMATYNIKSRAVMDRILRDLVGEGLLTVIQGSGIYVRRRHLVRRDLVAGIRLEYRRALVGDTSEGLFEAMTGTDNPHVQPSYARIDAPLRVADLLGIEPDAPVLERTFRYLIDGTPHQVARSYLPTALAAQAGLTGPDVEQRGTSTMAQLHAAGITIGRVHIDIETRMPTADETAALAVPPGTPVYEHWRCMYRPGETVPVEVSTSIVPGDRIAYVLDIDLTGGDQ